MFAYIYIISVYRFGSLRLSIVCFQECQLRLVKILAKKKTVPAPGPQNILSRLYI